MFLGSAREHLAFAPLEGCGGLAVDLDEGVDSTTYLVGAGEAGPLEGGAGQDREPAFDLVEPAGIGGSEVKENVGMTRQPAVVLGFVGVEIVEDDVDLLLRVVGNQIIHEVQELTPPAAFVVPSFDLPRGHFERRKERRGTMSFVGVGKPHHRLAVGQSEVSLRPLARPGYWAFRQRRVRQRYREGRGTAQRYRRLWQRTPGRC